MGRRWQRNRNDSGSLFASVFILALGSGCCLFTVAALSPGSLPTAVWTVGGIAGSFTLLVILQRSGRLPSTDLSFLLTSLKQRRDDGAADYQPRKAVSERQGPTGTNRPISAEEVHEIKVTSANTWVPAQSRTGKRK